MTDKVSCMPRQVFRYLRQLFALSVASNARVLCCKSGSAVAEGLSRVLAIILPQTRPREWEVVVLHQFKFCCHRLHCIEITKNVFCYIKAKYTWS